MQTARPFNPNKSKTFYGSPVTLIFVSLPMPPYYYIYANASKRTPGCGYATSAFTFKTSSTLQQRSSAVRKY